MNNLLDQKVFDIMPFRSDDLIGDVFDADADDIEVDEYGDVVEYEDGVYDPSVGDSNRMFDAFEDEETGALFRRRRTTPRRGQQRRIARRSARLANRQNRIANRQQTLQTRSGGNQVNPAIKAATAQRAIVARGGIPKSAMIPFLDVVGGVVKNAPIEASASFLASVRETMIKTCHEDRPYSTFIKTAVPSSGTITLTVAATEIYGTGATLVKVPFFFVRLASSALNAINNRPYQFQFSLQDTLGGSLTIGNVDVLSKGQGAVNINLCFTPWTLIASKPQPALCGPTGTASEFTITIPGVTDDDYSATLVIPGMNDPSIGTFLEKIAKG
jgi:hypothetical protein